jgi:hypothetical protein
MSMPDGPVIVPLLTIVRRGAVECFRLLEEEFAGEPVRVMWDRRVRERRRPSSSVTWRGSEDRRSRAAATWETMNFVIVEATSGEASDTADGSP